MVFYGLKLSRNMEFLYLLLEAVWLQERLANAKSFVILEGDKKNNNNCWGVIHKFCGEHQCQYEINAVG